MKRFLLAMLLLFVASPVRAEASVGMPSDAERYAFTAADTDPGPGVVRSVSGLELLLELNHRTKTRTFEGKTHGPRRPREVSPFQAQLLLAFESSRVALARQAEPLCADCPFQVYTPYHANPPPGRA